MLKDLDKLDNFLFEFHPFLLEGETLTHTVDPEKEDKELVEMIGEVSTSFKNIASDDSRKWTYKENKAAYKISADYFETMLSFDENDYEDQFKSKRDDVFLSAIQALFAINKKGFLNGFNLKYLSLPIEHSHLHNFWAYTILKFYL
jgi:hypothetical protein